MGAAGETRVTGSAWPQPEQQQEGAGRVLARPDGPLAAQPGPSWVAGSFQPPWTVRPCTCRPPLPRERPGPAQPRRPASLHSGGVRLHSPRDAASHYPSWVLSRPPGRQAAPTVCDTKSHSGCRSPLACRLRQPFLHLQSQPCRTPSPLRPLRLPPPPLFSGPPASSLGGSSRQHGPPVSTTPQLQDPFNPILKVTFAMCVTYPPCLGRRPGASLGAVAQR